MSPTETVLLCTIAAIVGSAITSVVMILTSGNRAKVVQVPADPPMTPLLRPDTHGDPLSDTDARLIASWEQYIAFDDPDFKKAFEGREKP